MAQPYTARQLGFFKTTLKILESAILDAELLATEAEALQKIPAASITADTTPPVIDQDTSGVRSSYFSAMPEPSGAFQSAVTSTYPAPIAKVETPSIVAAVTELPSVKNSSAFFQSLPWQDGLSFTPIIIKATPVSDSSSVDSKTAKVLAALDIFDVTPANAKSSTAYFRSLPWKGQPRSPAVIPQLATDSLPGVADTSVSPDTGIISTVAESIPSIVISSASPTVKTCATFFQSLPWDNTVHAPSAKTGLNSTAVEKQSATITLHGVAPAVSQTIALDDNFANSMVTAAITANNQTAKNTTAGFFRSLPWHGQGQTQAVDSRSILAAMDNDDFATISNLATQTALQAAQRGNNEYSVDTPLAGRNTASGFFQTLPW
jgi:hypothetical protein